MTTEEKLNKNKMPTTYYDFNGNEKEDRGVEDTYNTLGYGISGHTV
jgi:hypothetical protein